MVKPAVLVSPQGIPVCEVLSMSGPILLNTQYDGESSVFQFLLDCTRISINDRSSHAHLWNESHDQSTCRNSGGKGPPSSLQSLLNSILGLNLYRVS